MNVSSSQKALVVGEDSSQVMDNAHELRVGYELSDNGFQVRVNENKFAVNYPERIWHVFPSKIKKEVVENFVFLSTYALPAVINKDGIAYDMNSPLLQSFFLKPILYDIPISCIECKKDSTTVMKNFLGTKVYFKSHEISLPNNIPDVEDRSVNPFTFGKDSLLSFALAEEMGLNPVLVYIEEPDSSYVCPRTNEHVTTYQNKHKDALIKKFSLEFKKNVYKIKNQLGLIRDSEYFNIDEPGLSWSSQLKEYALLLLPFNYQFKARYTIYGNEASCSDYIKHDGFLITPSFEQSKEWTLEINKFLEILTRRVSAISLIESIHELAVTKILYSRYPHYAKYQMSCLADANSAKSSRWCHNCSKCARVFAFLRANSINPKSVGFKENLFTREKMHLFSLFGAEGKTLPYDITGFSRDEQLYAFYLAYKNGVKGDLIDAFKRSFLEEAKEREDEFHAKFFGIHDSKNIPSKFIKYLKSIYKEELS